MPSQLPAPKVWPVAEGAWQIRLPLPWALKSVNVFLFRSRNGYFLLDTGLRTEDCLLALERSLDSVGVSWAEIDEILVSHLHPDHIGAAAEIRRRTGAPVRMPAGEADLVKPLGPDRQFFAESGEFLVANGMPAGEVRRVRERARLAAQGWERLEVDGTIGAEPPIEFEGGTLEIVSAPGHSPDQICLYCAEQKALFSTDAILPGVTPNIGVQWFYQEDPLGDYLDTLSSLERLDVETVLPSHGRPFQGHREWISGTRRHHDERCRTILEAVCDRPLHAYEIAGAVWGEDLPEFDRRFAMSEALSHLHFMALSNEVDRVLIDGVAHWKAP